MVLDGGHDCTKDGGRMQGKKLQLQPHLQWKTKSHVISTDYSSKRENTCAWNNGDIVVKWRRMHIVSNP
jgi:hypothetical protein